VSTPFFVSLFTFGSMLPRGEPHDKNKIPVYYYSFIAHSRMSCAIVSLFFLTHFVRYVVPTLNIFVLADNVDNRGRKKFRLKSEIIILIFERF